MKLAGKTSGRLPALRFALALVILATRPALVFGQSHNSGPAQSLTLQEYISELDRCSAILNKSPVDLAELRKLHEALPVSWTVTAATAHYTIDMAWLSGGLAAIEESRGARSDALAQTRDKLETYRADAKALADALGKQPDPAQSRARLNSILSGREFRGDRGPTWTDLLMQRIRDWIDRQLEKIFGHVRAKKIGNIVAWAVVVLAGLLMLFWTLRFLMQARQHVGMDLSGATPVGRDWRRWLRGAREAAGRGDYRAAIHAAYWAAIVRMEETKSLPEDRSRTPRESLKLVDRASKAYAPLLQLTQRFELVWYGYRAATAADWSDAELQLEILGCPRY